jgi:hypothetical protein
MSYENIETKLYRFKDFSQSGSGVSFKVEPIEDRDINGDDANKIHELDALFLDIWNKTFPAWSEHLKKSLPVEIEDESGNIAHDLTKTMGPHYVLPDFLNERYDIVKSKIKECVTEKTAHIYDEIKKTAPEIYRTLVCPDLEKISQSLIEMTKPETKHLIRTYKELWNITDKEVKLKLLPLLQKYISIPI